MEAEDSKVPPSGPVTTGSAAPATTSPAGPATTGRCSCEAERDGPTARHTPTPPAFVYAMGQIESRIPDLGVEQELAQSLMRTETNGMTDRQVLSDVLSRPENRYLARQMCYVLTIQGLDTYVLVPRDPADFALMADAIRPSSEADAIDVVIGVRGGVAPASHCGGLQLPVVTVDQLYSASISYLVQSIDRPESMDTEQFEKAAGDLLKTVMNVSGNVGASDEGRALNYLLLRYSAIYRKTFEQFMADYSLAAIDVRRSNLGGHRRIMDVIFTYASRKTDEVQKYFVPVDVTYQFPFRPGPLGIFYDHN
ncbi:hypothetical protein ACFU8W_49350 [Streptomyces sp. NPDC057565]|uniref:cyanobactin maturation protease PatG family protein n=1 Tax=Streptomyces sp. NPDC057565 TaxID=3346169 RepID=UPI00367E5BED